MGIIQLIGVFLFSSMAALVVASFQRNRQKQGAPAPFQVPLVSAGTRIPVVYGQWRVRPIVVWFGGSTTNEVIIYDTPLLLGFIHFSPTQAMKAGYEYGVTCMGLLCWGTARIADMVFADNKLLTRQSATQTVSDPSGVATINLPTVSANPTAWLDPFSIFGPPLDLEVYKSGHGRQDFFLPNIYGGPGRGGGVKGTIAHYIGSRQYSQDAAMVALLGAGNVPSYGDFCYVVYENLVMGESPTPPPIDYIVRGFGGAVSGDLRGDTHAAFILVHALTQPWYGAKEPEWRINRASFNDAGVTLFNEAWGMSLYCGGSSGPQIDTFQQLREACEQHAGGMLRENQETGQWEFKLMRDESGSFSGLQIVNESHMINGSLEWHRTKPNEVINSVTIEFSDSAQFYQPDTVTLKNDANIAMTQEVRPTKVSYLMCTGREQAWKIAARELKQQGTALGRGQCKTTRALWSALPGDVIRLNNAEHGLTDLLVRVMAVDEGKPEDGEMTITLVEDVFSHANVDRLADHPDPVTPIIPAIIRPSITAMKITVDTLTGVGTLDVTVLDPEHRITEIAQSTKSGPAAPSAFASIATGTPDTSDPTFPFNDHVTSDDLNGTYTLNVTLKTTAPSAIQIRVKYVGFSGTDIQEFTRQADFPKLDSPEAGFEIYATLAVALSTLTPTATATITKGTAVRVKFAASLIGTPSDGDVRAATSDTSAPWQQTFAAILAGETIYCAAFAYDAANNESNKAVAQITAPGGSGAPAITLSYVISGGDVIVTATGHTCDSAKIDGNTSATPSDAAVRATTAITTVPFIKVFPTPASGTTLHIAAFGYSGVTESTPKQTLDISGATISANPFVLSTPDATLPGARVLTDSATVTWDRSIAGQIKGNASGSGGGGTGGAPTLIPVGTTVTIPENFQVLWEVPVIIEGALIISGEFLQVIPVDPTGLAPLAHTHPASDIVSGQLALARGGTHADLSATGPGVFKQLTTGADATVSLPTEAELSMSDITTNDVSITKHGFVPKAPNDTTKFLRGDGTFASPPGGAGNGRYESSELRSGSPTSQDDPWTNTGTTLNARWTGNANWPPTAFDIDTSKPQRLYVRAAGNSTAIRAILQAIPAGDFAIQCEIAVGPNNTLLSYFGVILTDGTGGSANNIIAENYQDGNSRISVLAGTIANQTANVVGPYSAAPNPMVIRWERASGVYTVEFSPDGITGYRFGVTPGFTPTHMGLGGAPYTGELRATAGPFRYSATATTRWGKFL